MRTLPLQYAFPLLAPWRDTPFVLTRDGSLCAFVVHSGRDPDGMSSDDFLNTTLIAQTALAALPPAVRVQNYFWHMRDRTPPPRERGEPVCDGIERARAAHLAQKMLYRTRVLHVITLPTAALAGKTDLITLITSLMMAPFEAEARARIARAVSFDCTYRYFAATLDASVRGLGDAVDAYRRRWSLYAETELLEPRAAWSWVRALATLSSQPFEQAAPAPSDHWYASALHGEAYVCQVDASEYLKVETPARFARSASLVRFHGAVQPGFWARANPAAMTVPGDFVLATNVRHLSALQKALAFTQAKHELDRARFDLAAALANRKPDERDPKREIYGELAKELARAEALPDTWARAHVMAFAIGDTAEAARTTALALDTAFVQANTTPVWEVPGLFDAYRALQPGAAAFAPRELMLTGTQVAAINLHYRHSQGVDVVTDLGGEEPQIYLETMDGQPFGFSPFLGEKATIIGVGATRSGKTFFKNVTAAHFGKYAGMYVALDFDHGSEPVARLFGRDAGVFRHDAGLNPFRAIGGNLSAFKAHLTSLVLAILRSNDDPGMRSLAEGEQVLIDHAVDATLALPRELQTLSHFATHLPGRTRTKLARWLSVDQGRYGEYLDRADDSIGLLSRRFTAFNLAALKSDETALGPILTEILWRIRLAFEDLSRLRLPKRAAFDEAHLVLRHPVLGPFIAYLCRTAAKHKASVELWSHLPEEYADAKDWPAIRAAASTFLFTAVQDADPARYREVFNITAQDVAVIRSLVPKRDVYLIQPETGLRKRLVLDADPAMRALMSSTANDVAARLEAEALATVARATAKEAVCTP